MPNNLIKYWSFFKISFKNSLANRGVAAGTVFLLLILLFAYNRLWSVVGAETAQSGLHENFIWYLLMGELIILSTGRCERVIAEDIRCGTMAYYINKPVSFFAMRYMESLGATTALFLILTACGSLWVYGFAPQVPFSWLHFPVILLMVYLSSAINVLLCITLGYITLWVSDLRTLAMVMGRMAFIFGGALFPLTIYPDWFVRLAQWTPFYSIYYQTISLVYDFSWPHLLNTLALNILWTLIISTLVAFAYRKLKYKVNVYGG